VYLDRLVNFVNVRRLPASATQEYECLWAEEGTAIPAKHLLRLASGQTFKIAGAATVSRLTLLGFLFSVKKAVAGRAYQMQINNTIITYTAIDGDDEERIQSGMAADIEAAFLDVFETRNVDGGLSAHSKAGLEAFSMASSDTNLEFPLISLFSLASTAVLTTLS
jgi:hypothetical protein